VLATLLVRQGMAYAEFLPGLAMFCFDAPLFFANASSDRGHRECGAVADIAIQRAIAPAQAKATA
jgi:hypothetical protein